MNINNNNHYNNNHNNNNTINNNNNNTNSKKKNNNNNCTTNYYYDLGIAFWAPRLAWAPRRRHGHAVAPGLEWPSMALAEQ